MKKLLIIFLFIFTSIFSNICFADSVPQIYELRTYTAVPGKLQELVKWFNDSTLNLFKKYNLKSIGYWIPNDKPNTFIYIMAHPNRQEAAKNWSALLADPDFQAIFNEARSNGPLIVSIESVYMEPTDFSPLR